MDTPHQTRELTRHSPTPRRPTGALTRRDLLAGGLGGALLLLSHGHQASAYQEGGREVEDAFGTVTVPAQPERVIAVRHHHVGNMLALGVIPIGIVPDASEFPFPGHQEALAEVVNVRADTDWMLDIEKAMALQPDLILEMSGQEGEPWNEEMCILAKAAATTVCFPYGYTYEDEVKQNMRDVGVALNLEKEAEQVIAAYDERVAELKTEVAAADVADKPVASIIWQGEGNFFVPVGFPANMILRAVGLAQPAFQADPTGPDVELSFENLVQLNEADTVIVMLEGAGTQEELEASPVWQLLDPVKQGRVIFLDANLWGWEYMPALMSMLDDVEQQVLPVLTQETGSE
ncbi:MAG: ABC transporter substrate-binding protein [Thermomicrobiales bacterium]|nr:ABC transporter substrate-binding protein [Thermomicrobiales bacterium]